MIVAGYVALGYVVVIICYFTVWCRPFQRYWDMIPPDAEHRMILSFPWAPSSRTNEQRTTDISRSQQNNAPLTGAT